MNRSTATVLAGLSVVAVATALSLWSSRRDETPPAPPPPTTAAAPHPVQPKVSEPSISPIPSFDVVRINAEGETVIAGRGMPRAEIVILDGGTEIGRVIADNRGEWVFVPDKQLPPGTRELTLKATNPDGSTAESAAPVVLIVPERANGKAMAVKVNPDGSVQLLTGPEAKDGSGPVSIGLVKTDDQGRLSASGKATPQAKLSLYLDGRLISRQQADADGQWSLTQRVGDLWNGSHTLRIDMLNDKGKVSARAEASFITSGSLAPNGKIVVETGNSLWRIARGAYGSGFQYMTIYQANRDQIRDPDKIYPGQVFLVPGEANHPKDKSAPKHP